MTALSEVFVRVRPDTTGLSEEMKREVEASAKRVDSKVNIGVRAQLDRSLLTAEIAKLKSEFARTGDLNIKAKIDSSESLFNKLKVDSEKAGTSAGLNLGKAFTEATKRSSNEVGKSLVGSSVKMGEDAGVGAGKAFGSVFNGNVGTALRNPTIAAALVATIVAAAPAIGAAVGAAVITGIATAGIGAGLAIAFQDPAVQLAGAELGKTLKAELTDVAQPFIQEVRKAIPNISSLFVSLKPQLAGIFSTLAPQFDTVLAGLIEGVKSAVPGISTAISAAKPFADALGKGLVLIGVAVGDFFNVIATHKEGALAFFNALTVGVVGVIEILGGLIAELSTLNAAFVNTQEAIVEGFIKIGKAILPVLQAMGVINPVAKLAADGLGKAVSGLEYLDNGLHKLDEGLPGAALNLKNLGTTASLTGRDAIDASLAFAQAKQAFKDQQTSLKDAVTSTAQAVTSAYQGIADANHGVLAANIALQDSIYAVGKAERTLVKDHDAEKQAQLDLIQARKDAIKNINDLKFATINARNAVSEDALSVESLQQQVSLTGGLDPTLNLKLKEAKDKQKEDLAKSATAQNSYNDAVKKGVEGNKGVIDAHKNVKNAQQQTRDDEEALTKAHQAETEAQYNLTKAHQAVTTAQRNYTTAVKNHNKAVQDASKTLDINTAAGNKNAAALLGVWDAYVKMNPDQAKSLTQFEQLAASMGLNKTEADSLFTSITALPENKTVTVTTKSVMDLSALTSLATGANIGSIAVDLGKAIGLPVGKATGGLLDGPGTGTSDSIPLWGSKGEFMQSAAATAHYGVDFMDKLNKRQIPKLAHGGSIDEIIGVAQASGIGFDYPNNSQLTGGKHAPGSLHYKSEAVDFGASNNQGNANKLSKYFMDNYGSSLLEEIHSSTKGSPWNGWYIKDGHVVAPYGPASEHYNHLHVGAAPGFTKKSGKPISGSIPPSPVFTESTSISVSRIIEGLQLLGAAVAKDQAIAEIFSFFGIPFKNTLDFSKPGGIGAGKGTVLPISGKGNYEKRAFIEAAKLAATNQQMLALFETANVESNWKNFANRNVPSSLRIPHDATGSDHYSVGILQQQVGASGTGSGYGWGNVAHAMSIEGATDAFISRAKSKGVFSSAGKLAQAVQVSAFPDRYDRAESKARSQLKGVGAKGYDQGGWLTNSPAINTTGKPEAVLTPDESAGLKAAVSGDGVVELSDKSARKLAVYIVQALHAGPVGAVSLDGTKVGTLTLGQTANILKL